MSIETDGGSPELTDDALLDNGGADDNSNPGDDAAANADDGSGSDQAKPKKTVQERIDELTRSRREAERRAEEAERREQALLDRVTGKGGAPEPKPAAEAEPKGDERPNPANYPDGIYDPEYLEALTDWKVDQRLKGDREAQAAEEAQRARAATRDERIKAAAEKHPDFHDKVVKGADRWVCTPIMANAMGTSEAEAEIAYHLATNPDESKRIAALDAVSQVREIGRLEAKLSSGPATPSPKTVSDAPPPPQHARGHGGRFAPDAATDDFAAFERLADSKLAGN